MRNFYAQFRYVLVDEYQTIAQYLQSAVATITATSRRRSDQTIYKWRGADLGTFDFERGFPKRTRQARTELPFHAGDSRRGVGRDRPATATGKAAVDRPAGRQKILYVRAGDGEEARTSSPRRSDGRRADTERPSRSFARTRSRAIKDALARGRRTESRRRRFYERGNPDASPTCLIMNPHDGASFRRRNVPTAASAERDGRPRPSPDESTPDAALDRRLEPVVSPRSLWARLAVVLEKRLAKPRR